MHVLLVEDEPWIRRSVEAMLHGEGVHVTAVGRGRDAIRAIEATRPRADGHRASDVPPFAAALVDLGLPDVSGIEVIAELRRLQPGATPVAFTVFDDAPTILAALRAGARGYVLKSTPSERILPQLREAMAGGMPLSPSVAALVVETMLGADAGAPASALTQRETELLALLARGATYAQCAEALGIGVGTVQSYVKSIYAKLDVASKAEAAVVAVRLGLVP